MECERLKKLIKNWYVQVQDESMAPARMVDFMNNHVSDCSICMADPVIEIEIKRITEIVLPPAKIPKAVRKVKAADEQKADDKAPAADEQKADDKAPAADEQEADDKAPAADDAAPEDVETTDVDKEDDVDQDEDDVDVDPDEDEI